MKNKATEERIEESGAFWKKIKDSKLTSEEFERIEALESAIARYEEKIGEYEEEIKNIMETAKKKTG